MLLLSNADLQVEQIFRASSFCPLIIVLITFPDADGFFNFLNQSRSQIEQMSKFINFEVIVKIFMS